MIADVMLDPMPIILIVANALAVGANGQQPLKLFDAGKGILKFNHSPGQLGLQLHHLSAHEDAGLQFFDVEAAS